MIFRPTATKRLYCSRKCYREAPGARRRATGGYATVYRPDHPACYPSGQILEHRVVMEQMIGRYLLPDENVHHINGVKDDNRPENLELWITKQPKGQRVEDKVQFAIEMLRRYRPEALNEEALASA